MKAGEPFNPYKLFTGIFIPEALVRWPDVSPGAKLCYGRLARYAGENGRCFPSLATLGRELGTSRDSAKRYVQELTTVRLIRGERRKTDAGDPDTSQYVFLWHTLFESEGVGAELPLPGRCESAPTVGAEMHRGVGAEMPPKESQTKSVIINESPVQESQSEAPRVSEEPAASTEPNPPEKPSSVDDEKPSVEGKLPERPKELRRVPYSPTHDMVLVDDMYGMWHLVPKIPVEETPRDALLRIYKEKAGSAMGADLLRNITEAVELQGATMADYIAALKDGGHLRNKWTNPAGFLLSFARKLERSTRTAAPTPAAPTNGKCGCGRTGWINGVGWCPDCDLGRDLKRDADRQKRKAQQEQATA